MVTAKGRALSGSQQTLGDAGQAGDRGLGVQVVEVDPGALRQVADELGIVQEHPFLDIGDRTREGVTGQLAQAVLQQRGEVEEKYCALRRVSSSGESSARWPLRSHTWSLPVRMPR